MNQDFQICWSEFPTLSGNAFESYEGTPKQFINYLKRAKAPSKKDCSLISMVDFGNVKTTKGSYRHDTNIIAMFGVVADYDGGLVDIEVASKRLTDAGIYAILYTTPSNSKLKPKWRVICPTSKDSPKSEYRRLTQALKDVLEVEIDKASFTPSQSYYFGDVGTNDYRVIEVEGEFIDKVQVVDKVQAPTPLLTPLPDLQVVKEIISPETIRDLRTALAIIPSDDRALWVDIGHALKTIANEGVGLNLFIEWSAKSPAFDPSKDLTTWESFNPTNTGYAKIFAEAQRRGWANPIRGEPVKAFSLSELESLIVPIEELSTIDIPTPHVIDKLIPCDEVTLLAGHGGSGKSQIALNMAVHIALGLPFADLKTKQTNVLFFSGEDGRVTLEKRIKNLCHSLSISPNKLKDRLHLLDASDIDPALHREQRVAGAIKLETSLVTSLHYLMEKLHIGFIVIDNASDTFDDDEIKRVRVRAFVRSLRTHLARPSKAVLLLAHVNKQSARGLSNEEDYSGSTAWHNSVRSRLSLIQANKLLKLIHQKANYSELAEPIYLCWTNGVPLVNGSIPEHVTAQKTAIANDRGRDEEAKKVLMQILQVFFERGEPVNASLTGAYSSFKTMKSDPTFPDILKSDVDRFKRLMREMQDEQLIIRKTIKTLARREKEIFVNTAPLSSKFPHIGAENA